MKKQPEEIWKPLVYKGFHFPFYEISNLGRIKSLPRDVISRNGVRTHINGKILAVRTNRIEPYYFFDAIYELPNGDKKKRTVYIHRAVYESFIGWAKDMYITHKDRNTFNNFLSNLYPISHSELQKRNLIAHPENRNRLRNFNLKSGYYKLMSGKKRISDNKILAIKELSKKYSPKIVADMLSVSLSVIYKYKNNN